MNKIYFNLAFIFLSFTMSAQQWSWAMHEPGAYASQMDEDLNSNIYAACGITTGPDATELAKYDSAGNAIWTKTITCLVGDLKVGNSHFVISGNFTGSVTFDNVTLSSSDMDGFVAYYDFAGNLQWVKQASGASQSDVGSVALNSSDQVFFAMTNQGATSFAGANFVKGAAMGVLDNSGTLTDNFQISGNIFYRELKLKTDANDNMYLIGGYNDSTLVIGGTTIVCGDAYYGAYFMAKLQKNGTVFWAKDMGSKYKKTLANICVGPSGNFYYTYSNTYTSGNLIKAAPNGTGLWSQNIASAMYGEIRDMKIDQNENLTLTGELYNSGTFGACTVSGTSYFLFTARMDSAGNCYWVKTGQASDVSSGENLSIKNSSHVMMQGWVFSNLTEQLPPLSVQGTNFLAKISLSGNNAVENKAGRMEDLIIYPNPSRGNFFVDVRDNMDSHVRVFDLLGNCVLEKKMKKPRYEIDLGKEAQGIYFVETEASGKKSLRKIVVE